MSQLPSDASPDGEMERQAGQMSESNAIVDTYRWHRGLGHEQVALPCVRIIVDTAHPDVWDANHADAVSATTEEEIDGVLNALDRYLAHSNWRVVHTDPSTPETFLARLAMDGFEEQPAVIQMALHGPVHTDAIVELHPVVSDEDWKTLGLLVLRDHEEGARTGGMDLMPEVSEGIVAGYRRKAPQCPFFLATHDGDAIAYGSCAVGPSGAGIIEDLFTVPSHRGRGVASAMIRAFAERLHDAGCSTVFLGALATEPARHLYAKLGFRPVLLTRTWAKRVART